MKRVLERGVRPRDWTIFDTQKAAKICKTPACLAKQTRCINFSYTPRLLR